MLRTRLLWFSIGFTVSAAAVSHFVWKDLWVDRHALSADMKQKFDALETRVLNLESVPHQNSISDQAQG
ncbi:putative Fanconi anemia group D2 protein [Quillaja saponaria]|uniref:Fanconi anemia group D2 protein n=1 Tax=Quillaja saponaria TaxID=32244 RepID=A0AAD7L374_QUISA|nr:putative Fanconi anemia group D2 protein [Quillaja saponaria]